VAIAFSVMSLISATLFLLSVLVLKNLYLGIALVAAIVFVFRIVLLRSLGKRQAIFEKQLVDSLDLGARSLRAGHPLSGAFRLMAEEMEDPVGTPVKPFAVFQASAPTFSLS